VFEQIEPIDPHGICHVDHPLAVSGIGGGVSIAPAAILTCHAAESLALWAKHVMVPAARLHLDTAPRLIAHGSTYVCRPRNNVAGAKMSEHAHANAVDIVSIAFPAREPLTIGSVDETETEGEFLAAIREGACDYFTTVLGPGSDAAHAEHFHFDMAKRRGGYRLCELGDENTASVPANTKRE
jgi:hypothetical protein